MRHGESCLSIASRRLAMMSGIALVTLILGCGPDGTGEIVAYEGEDPMPVVVTHSILADMVANIAGDRIAVKVMVPADGDAHAYTPTPADARILANTHLIIEQGFRFETWLNRLYRASGSQAGRLVAARGITPRLIMHHGHREADPHTWQDVQMSIIKVRNLAEGLATADPRHAEPYRVNAEAYIAELEELDRYILERAGELPDERRVIVTSHESMGYFGQRYGFRMAGSALASITTDAADPSARQLRRIIDEIRQAGIPAVFADNIQDDRLMAQVARETGVVFVPGLYTDALGPPGSAGGTYIGMMRHNIDLIVGALKP